MIQLPNKFKLFGQRVAAYSVEEEQEGSIVTPQTMTRMHLIAEVVAVGDGKSRDGTVEMVASVGDVVLYQIGSVQAGYMAYHCDGKKEPVFIFDQRDLIARLTSKKINFESIEMLGKWVLIKIETRKHSFLELPDNVQQPEFKYYRVAKKGAKANPEINIGDEVSVDRSRANPLVLNGDKYAFIIDESVTGVVTPNPDFKPELEKADEPASRLIVTPS